MYENLLKNLHLNTFKNLCLSSVMSKSKKAASEAKNKISIKNETLKNNEQGAVFLGKNNEIIMKIHAKPGAKQSAITDVGAEAIGLQISAPPVDGEANKELIRYLAEILKLRKSDISLDRGSRSKDKKVIITTNASLNDVLDTLKAASKQ